MSDIVGYDEAVDLAETRRDEARPHFYFKAKQHKAKSVQEGRPIFRQLPYVKILIPGDSRNIVDRPVNDTDKKRWPREWRSFEERQENVEEGTPIQEWPFLNVAQVAEFTAMNIRTVEQLANLSDTGLDRIGTGARALQARAKSFLKPAAENEVAQREEKQAMLRRISELEAKLEQALHIAPPKRKRGRPRKNPLPELEVEPVDVSGILQEEDAA